MFHTYWRQFQSICHMICKAASFELDPEKENALQQVQALV